MKKGTAEFSVTRVALVTGLGGIVVSFAAAVVGLSAGSATAGMVVRAVLVTALLVTSVRAVCPADVSRPRLLAALGAGYALDITWWGGGAYAARLLVDSVPVAALADLVLWIAVGWIATVWLARTSDA